jgi:hypothetical protein
MIDNDRWTKILTDVPVSKLSPATANVMGRSHRLLRRKTTEPAVTVGPRYLIAKRKQTKIY